MLPVRAIRVGSTPADQHSRSWPSATSSVEDRSPRCTIAIRRPRRGSRSASRAGSASVPAVPTGDPQSATSTTAKEHTSNHTAFLARFCLVPDVTESDLDIFPSFFPDFLWAHRSGNSSPLRPTRLLLCRFRPQQHWVPSNKADASLRLHAPSLSVVPPKKTGQKVGKQNVLSQLSNTRRVRRR
jgi:hypothetical protein